MRIHLAIPITIENILFCTKGLNNGLNNKTAVEYITTNSKEAEFKDLFIALKGERFSGEDFLEEAKSKGAIPLTSKNCDFSIFVKDTNNALLDIANYYKQLLKNLKHTVAITGSVGKTTVKEMLKVLSCEKYITHATSGNQNNSLGVPITILSAPYNCQVLILEMGMNHLREISALSKCAKPTLSVITKIGSSHIGNLGSRKMIAKAKSEIADGMSEGYIITEHGESLLKDIPFKKTVSVDGEIADFSMNIILESNKNCIFNFKSKNIFLSHINTKVTGKHNLYNLALAVSCADLIGLNKNEILEGINKINSYNLRHRVLKMKDYIIIDDSYNSSYESVIAMIKYILMYKGAPHSAFLGDILELGTQTEEIHRKIGKFAFENGIDRLYLYGVYSKFIEEGAKEAGMNSKNIFVNSDYSNIFKSVSDIINYHEKNEIILFKASHKLHIEKIIDKLKAEDK